MICNICGGEIPEGKNICKYCGNMVTARKHTESEQKIDFDMPPKAPPVSDARVDAEIYRPNRIEAQYCRICGRPLDGVTHKCIVCDAKEVGSRAYTNEEYKHREMDIMAKRKKKKNNTTTVLGVILAVLGTIALFLFAIVFARGHVADWLGIGSTKDDMSIVTSTHKPKVTADPNWKAEVEDDEDEKKQTPIPTERPVRTPVPEPTGDPVELRGGKYLYPSDTHLITEDELKEMTRTEIKNIYWEIYARHGYTFDGELADYFENNHEWYLPTTTDEAKVESQFNSIEKRNKETIYNYQKKMGWR